MSEEKFVSLEEKIAFLQNMIDDLNMVVFRQGKKIEILNNQIKETNKKIISQSEPQPNLSEIIDNKPPHY
jgi:SlyX protein